MVITVHVSKIICLWLIILLGALTLLNLRSALQCKMNSDTLNNTNISAESFPAHDRYSPLIFIGGFPRSGTTLMRAMLDSHPEVRCGRETRIIPHLLDFHRNIFAPERENIRLKAAGITRNIIDSAFANLILEIIAKHDYLAPRLCNKDPMMFMHAYDLHKMFPNAKFLFMVRDGRAVVHSILTRNITFTGMKSPSFREALHNWNVDVKLMAEECRKMGEKYCLKVYYEQLVLQPKFWMEKILSFLALPWSEQVLHHEQFINKTRGVPLSAKERSTDQVTRPIYLDSLSTWFGHIPKDVVRDMNTIAPMLSFFGYDPSPDPPNYSGIKIDTK